MSYEPETPFDNIESAHEFIDLLKEAIDEAKQDVDSQIAAAEGEGAERRQQALKLVQYNLTKLGYHVTTSRRILNDLRSLRRLLLEERHARSNLSRREAADST